MPNAAEIGQVATCVWNGNEWAFVKELKSLKANVRGLVEDVKKVCYATFCLLSSY